MKLTPVCMDIETFWSQEHTLTKMNPIAYCVHPETELLSLAYKFNDDPAHCIVGEKEIKAWAKQVDWSDKLVYGHNMSLFDAMILRWRLGIKPAMWGCTLAMARPFHMLDVGGSLSSLVEHYGLGVKDQTAIINTKGRHLKDFSFDEIAALKDYNKADVEQCAALFKVLLPKTPKREMKLIDATIRMLVEPKFRVDIPLLEKTLVEERERKHLMLLDTATMIGINPNGKTDDEIADEVSKTLASAPKFAKLLKDLGVEPPMKPSPTNPEKKTYALAKTDEAFIALTEHEDPVVAAAANARLGVKSTILESRIESFLSVARMTGGRMPIALLYHGAHTGRWSGALALNQQNLPRVSGKPTDVLRKSLIAPPGYKVVVADLSGIELRVNHFLWQVPSSMALFNASPDKADLYKDFAAKLYNKSVEEVTKAERQIGKVSHLGLGYGAGPTTFVRIAKMMGGVDITEDESREIVTQWREAYSEIVQGWKKCQAALSSILDGAENYVDPWELIKTTREGLMLPSGRVLRYPNLRKVEAEGKVSWKYGDGRHERFLTGGKIDENCIAEGTLVLTDSGWKPIERVTTRDLVHDGYEFVRHGGIVFKSVQPCVTVDGVYMTADHEVLDEYGQWVEAQTNPRPYRPNLRFADGAAHERTVSLKSQTDVEQAYVASRPEKPVYDILNAGKRHCFVVLGDNGPFIVHNCVQALSRDILADNIIEIKRLTGYLPCHMVHDELVYVVPEEDAEKMLAEVQAVMRTPPTWWPDLVTWSEGNVGDSYGDAK